MIASLAGYFFVIPYYYCEGESAPASFSPTFSFNNGNAVKFYDNLMTPIGLETPYNGSKTVWLSDDQGLDYSALMKIYSSTGNATSLKIASEIKSSIQQWGGFYAYWNPVFEVFGSYPNSTAVISGNDITVGMSGGYTINTTKFTPNPGFNYSEYADQLAYRVLLNLHNGNYCAAESSFNMLSGMWSSSGGKGFADKAFQDDPLHIYQSFKLALYIITWKALANVSATQRFALGYQTTAAEVAALMSSLQSPTGGVWTGYKFSANGQMVFGQSISLTNGETTSLFVLANF